MGKIKKEKKGIKTNNKVWKPILVIEIILLIIFSGYLIYNILLLGPIEKIVRYVVIGVLCIIDLVFLVFGLRLMKHPKRKKCLLFIILGIIYFLISAIGGVAINRAYSSIDSINKDYVTYSTSVVTLSDSELSSISDLNDLKIALISDTTSVDYIIGQEIIKENKLNEKNDIVDYDDFSSMMRDLYDKNIDAIIISSNYPTMFSSIEEYNNISNETKSIVKKEKKMKKVDTANNMGFNHSTKAITEPFTILLMGVDSEVDGLDKDAVANGDALMLITFNPKTLSATMLSIPRDSYVPIACFKNQIENKITHAAWYGESCMQQTIQNFLGIDIDYYVKINFKGVVGLVDALGGIDVDVPQDLCTDNSDRAVFLCINQGFQHLNGEEALVLARNRKSLALGDVGRGLNQQIVIQGIMNSAKKKITDVSALYSLLDTVSRNMDTNFTTEQILSFYNIGKDILLKSLSKNEDEVINIQQLFLDGTNQMIYDEGMRMVLSNYVPNNNSIDDVVHAMKVNLGLDQYEMIKDFSFSINEPYEKKLIGEGPYKTSNTYTLLPDFSGDNQSTAERWANANGVRVSFEQVAVSGSGYRDGIIFEQSVPAKKRLDKLGNTTVVLKIAKVTGGGSSANEILDCSNSKNNDNKECLTPNFTKMTKAQAQSWAKNFKNIKLSFNEVSKGAYPDAKVGQIVAQSIKYGTHLKDTKIIELTIVIEEEISEPEEEEKPDNSTEEDNKEDSES